jgi:DNA polymerase I
LSVATWCSRADLAAYDSCVATAHNLPSHDLRSAAFQRGSFLAISIAPSLSGGFALATESESWSYNGLDPVVALAAVEDEFRPRWVWWSANTMSPLVDAGLQLSSCWDIDAVNRLLFGGWKREPARIWAALHDLPAVGIPAMGQLDLLGADSISAHTGSVDDPEDPVGSDGYLRPEWTSDGWWLTDARLRTWASVALSACSMQRARLRALDPGGRFEATAKAESVAELNCVELELTGLPVDGERASAIIERFVGPRPESDAHAAAMRHERDAVVLAVAPLITERDLRSQPRVLAMLRAVGVVVPDTRAWRLEPFRATHPFVDALLTWRKAERMGSTFGYGWLDAHVGTDGRLRGQWSGSDGAAGRMTAQAGLHNMPADLRDAVRADTGFAFVHADLGQIEPRVLAAISGDAALAEATQSADLYAPIAERFGVERAVAKVAMLAAMYGQTSGVAGDVLKQMDSGYLVATQYLRAAEQAGREGRDIRTYGGRLVRMSFGGNDSASVAARGRYARNAMVQGAAAELFKVWIALVRARITPYASLVMCLHDELLIRAPFDRCDEVARIVESSLPEAAAYWHTDRVVRFVAEASVIDCWANAK